MIVVQQGQNSIFSGKGTYLWLIDMRIKRGGSLEKGARRLHVILFDLQYTFWLCGKQKYRDDNALWYIVMCLELPHMLIFRN